MGRLVEVADTKLYVDAELTVFENSAHMMFAEEQERYLATVRGFLDRVAR